MSHTKRVSRPSDLTLSSLAQEDESDNEQSSLEIFNEMLSDLGTHEICVCVFVLISGVICAWQTLVYIFETQQIEYKCIEPNISACDSHCPGKTHAKEAVTNIIMEWNLVCNAEGTQKAEITQIILILGIMFGSALFGHLAEQIGRRPSFLTACVVMILMSLLTSVTPWYWLFCGAKFFLGLGCGGTVICSLVFLVEFIDSRKREIMAFMFRLPYAVGYSLLPTCAYFIKNWRKLQLMISVFGLTCIVNFWLLPESPRWLLNTGFIYECALVLHQSPKNKNFTLRELQQIVSKAHTELRRDKFARAGTMVDLFCYKNMVKKTSILSFLWFSLFLKFFGTSDYIVYLGTNIYLHVGVSAWLTIIGTIVSFPLNKYFKRRKVLWITYSLSAIVLFCIPIVPNGKDSYLPKSLLAIIVIALASVTYVTLQIFSLELFPTILWNSGLGFTFCIGCLGSITSPFAFDTFKSDVISPILYGIFALISAFLIIFLPETKGKSLSNTIEDAENFGKLPKKDQI